MEIRFPDIPLYEGWGRPLRMECNLQGLELIEGHLPAGLAGTWYRAGPDPQFPPTHGEDIFIDGEGMVHMFRFIDDQVDYRSRYVHTARFLLQQKARRSLFGRYRNPYTNDPLAHGVHMGTANTNAVFHGGKLLALKEDDLPYEVDPDTLETRGRCDYAGQIKALRLSAHPKIDPVSGRLLTFSYQAKGDGTTDIVYYEIDETGRVTDEIWFGMPYSGMVHDFAITPTHVIFPFFPLITDVKVLMRGGAFYEWHADKPSIYAIVPRHGRREDIRWFRGASASAGHMMNAFNEGSRVHLDLVLYEGNCFPFFKTPAGEATQAVLPHLTRVTFDLARAHDGFDKRTLTGAVGEMPRTDDRYQGLPYSHGFMIVYSGQGGASSVARIEVETGKLAVWSAGPSSSVHEPQFVPDRPMRRKAMAGCWCS